MGVGEDNLVIVSYLHADGSFTNRSWIVDPSEVGRIIDLLDVFGTPSVEHHITAPEVDEAAALAARLTTPAIWPDA